MGALVGYLQHRMHFWDILLLGFVTFCLHISVSTLGISGATRGSKAFTLLFCIGSLLWMCYHILDLISFAGVVMDFLHEHAHISGVGAGLAWIILVLVLECSSVVAGAWLWITQRSVGLARMQVPCAYYSTALDYDSLREPALGDLHQG